MTLTVVAPARRKVIAHLSPELMRLCGYWNELEAIHKAFDAAAQQVVNTRQAPICVQGCGKCCIDNSVIAQGVEADYAMSWLAGQPQLHKRVMDACREWLTRPGQGKYSYGKGLNMEWFRSKAGQHEMQMAAHEPCPFLDPDKTCLIHYARPLVCRAYGVTHQAPDCIKPRGVNETLESEAWFDADYPAFQTSDGQMVSLKRIVQSFTRKIKEPRYAREGFLYFQMMERFYAKELAGLLDDGQIPIVKVAVGMGGTYRLLWQDQFTEAWSNVLADESIATQVPFKTGQNGLPVIVIVK